MSNITLAEVGREVSQQCAKGHGEHAAEVAAGMDTGMKMLCVLCAILERLDGMAELLDSIDQSVCHEPGKAGD